MLGATGPGGTRAAAALALGLLAGCGGEDRPLPSAPPAPAATREERWIQDIDYLAAELPRLHPNLFFQAPRGEFLASVADRAFGLMDRGAADRLVVDVRHNGGGDSRVDDHLIEGIESRSAWRQRGRLYCLVGGETFSSGLWTADDLRKLGAVLVGSPTGGKPNSYGNPSSFTLSNSLLQVGYSTRHYQLISGSDPPWLAPDLAVDETIADLRAGRDPLLDAAVSDRR